MATATVPGTGPAAEPAAADVYALGSNPAESARLQRQSDELRPQTAAARQHRPAARVTARSILPAARAGSSTCSQPRSARRPVLGLDANPAHVALARSTPAEHGLANATVVRATPGTPACRRARSTWCTPALVLVTIPEPSRGRRRDGPAGQAGRLGRCEEPDGQFALPPAASGLDRLREASSPWAAGPAPISLGRRLTELPGRRAWTLGVSARPSTRSAIPAAPDPATWCEPATHDPAARPARERELANWTGRPRPPR